MKKVLLPAIALLLQCTVLKADPKQNTYKKAELAILYSFGVSDRTFTTTKDDMFKRLDYQHARSMYDNGVLLKYDYSLARIGKSNFTVGAGVGYFNSKHFFPIAYKGNSYQLAKVVFDSKMISIPVSVAYERAMMNNKLFVELGFSTWYNQPLQEEQTYTGAEKAKFGYIDYQYDFWVKNMKSKSHSLTLTAKFNLYRGIFLNTSVSHLRSKFVSYNYEYIHENYTTDQVTGKQQYYYYSFGGLTGGDYELTDNYFYFSAGISYKF